VLTLSTDNTCPDPVQSTRVLPLNRAWRRLDLDIFGQAWQEQTSDLDRRDLNSKTQIDEYTEWLVKGAQVAVDNLTPRAWKARNTGDPEDRRQVQLATAKKGKALRAVKM